MQSHRRSFMLVLACFALVAATGCGFMANMARGDPSWRTITKQPGDYGLRAKDVALRSPAGRRISAWWIDADADRPARATVVLVHGRGGNRGQMLPRARFLVTAGYNVLAIDLRTSGSTDGEFLSGGYLEVEEIGTAVAYAHAVSPSPVVLLGHSIGAVAVLHTAAGRAPIVAAIADSPFISSFDVLDRYRAKLRREGSSVWPRIGLWFAGRRSLAGLMEWMMRTGGADDLDGRRADVLPVLPRIQVPVLMISGNRDDIAPIANARLMTLALRSPGSRLAEIPTTHDTFTDDAADYTRSVLEFLDRVVPEVVSDDGQCRPRADGSILGSRAP